MQRRTVRLILANFALWPLIYFVWNLGRFFPNASGRVGHDYGAITPWLISGLSWRLTNGVTSIPEFVPSFCAGVPLVFNPQSVYFSLPGLLLSVLPPLPSFMVSWIVFALIGGLSTFCLLRHVFRTSPEAALVGAVLFMLNGFFFFRMVIGHATFHAFMLLPAMTWSLVPASERGGAAVSRMRETIGRSVLFAAMLAYVFYSGGVYVLTTVPLMLASLLLVAYLTDRCDKRALTILVCGGCLGVGLCLYRLLPAMAYSANVPRLNELVLSGSLVRIVGGALVTLFIPQVLAFVERRDVLNLMRHELEFGVGLAPLFILLAGAVYGVVKGTPLTTLMKLPARKVVALAALVVVLLLPIVLCYSGFGLRWLLSHTPVIKSMSNMLRFWSVYIPFLCVVSAIVLDRLVANPRQRLAWSAAAIALTIVQSASTNVTFYEGQSYDPRPMTVAYQHLRGGLSLPAIDRVERPTSPDNFFWNDGFLNGATTLPCYEPMFGYFDENFPLGRIETGPVMQSSRGLLNLKNPACYVFPDANDCRAGSEFTDAQRASADAFRNYKPFPYRWPIWEYAATATTLACIGFCVLVGAYEVFAWSKRRMQRL